MNFSSNSEFALHSKTTQIAQRYASDGLSNAEKVPFVLFIFIDVLKKLMNVVLSILIVHI